MTEQDFIHPQTTIIGKGIAYVKPLNQNLPLRPIEIEFKNNRCCMEIHQYSDSTVEFYMAKNSIFGCQV